LIKKAELYVTKESFGETAKRLLSGYCAAVYCPALTYTACASHSIFLLVDIPRLARYAFNRIPFGATIPVSLSVMGANFDAHLCAVSDLATSCAFYS